MRTLALVTLLAPLAVSAAPRQGPLDVERFHASPSGTGLSVAGAETLPEGALRFGALSNWSQGSLGLYDADGVLVGQLVDDRLSLDVTAAWGVLERLELGLVLPIVLSQSAQLGGEGFLARPTAESLAGAGLSDPALQARFRLLRAEADGLDLALSAAATAPVSGGQDFLGEPHATFVPKLGLGLPVGRDGRMGLELGFRAREDREDFYGLPVSDELLFGLGARLGVASWLAVKGEVAGATRVAAIAETNTTPLEALAAAVIAPGGGVELTLGGGAGLTPGVGAPGLRVLAGIAWSNADPAAPEAPRCAAGPEDLDGVADDDGCLDPDDDGDGLVDVADRCPEAHAGTDADRDGCPDAEDPFASFRSGLGAGGDPDRDGVPDSIDLCKAEPEDPDGFQDDDGCPDTDNDVDGVPDAQDACPLSAGDNASRGCPTFLAPGGRS